jgi:hypothetical protein
MVTYIVSCGAQRRENVPPGDLMTVSDELASLGPLTIVERADDGAERTILDAGKPPSTLSPDAATIVHMSTPVAPIVKVDPEPSSVKPVSTWTHQVSDDEARARIEAQHDKLRTAGVNVNASEQLYATGTRMATVGYDTQREEAPTGMTIEDAIPGFYSWLLRDRSSELAGVLPGRTAMHVEGLTAAFASERRDSTKLVRSDFAQGWTRYIQSQSTPVRRDAESAIGRWLVQGGPIEHEAV